MVIAIHQPNFFPWLGFFDKIFRSDKFVLLDDVQFSKKGGTWTNRVPILINNEKKWISIPINRAYHGYKLINEIEINEKTPWRKKTFKQIYYSYKKYDYFDEIMPWLEQILEYKTTNLCEFNLYALEQIFQKLNIDKNKIIISSKLFTTGKGSEKLISIVQSLNGNVYLSGDGAVGYQDIDTYNKKRIELKFQQFNPPVYKQKNNNGFLPGLSIIDSFMNIGYIGTYNLVKKNIQNKKS